jgi:CBS domain-containing protein
MEKNRPPVPLDSTAHRLFLGELLVLDEHLWGMLDRNDLPEIVARIAVIPLDRRGDAGRRRLSEFLVENPLTIALDDSSLVAYATMVDHGISWLPVVQIKEDPQPVGYVRGDRIAERMIQRIGRMQAQHADAAS